MALDFAAGCVGGAAGVLVGYPLDTVKVRIQTQDPTKGLQYKGTYDCLTKIIKSDGVKGLYKGMSSPLAGVAAINAITFGVYGNVLRQLSNPESVSAVTLAGASAGLVQTCIVSPMELIKTQMQVGGESKISETVKNIYNRAGLTGLCRGMGITLTREVPAFAIYFGSYEIMTRSMGDSTAAILGAGGMAGVFSWVFTYPQDVIKSRLQADAFGAGQKYRGPLHCTQLSLRAEGYQCLSRGMVSTVIRAFPMNATTFFVYSYFMKTFGGIDTSNIAEDVYDTLKSMKRLGSNVESYHSVENIANSWGREKAEMQGRVTTIATDMPSILLIQEPTNISQMRMYPEQMLYACADSQETRHHDSTFFFHLNFNQFNQQLIEVDPAPIPTVFPSIKLETPTPECTEEPYRPSLLVTENKNAKWKSSITMSDFLLPTNLLSSSRLDRIYGFYYLVA